MGELDGHSYPEWYIATNPHHPEEHYCLYIYNQNTYPSCENEVSKVSFVHYIERDDHDQIHNQVRSLLHIHVAYNSQYESYAVGAYRQNAAGVLTIEKSQGDIESLMNAMVATMVSW
jgi:hypothetical protein